VSAVGGVVGRTARAFRDAGRDVGAEWSPVAWLAVGAVVLAALVPLVLPSSVRLDGLADTGYLALAAVGLGFAVGIGGIPSLAQGAFVGVGAVTAAHAVEAGWPALAAALLGAALAGAAGVVVGIAIARLRPVYVVAATWLATWLFSLALDAFPSLSGGARGLVVAAEPILGFTPTPTVHYELALALVALGVLGHRTLARSSFGLSLRAAAQRPAGAAALGVPIARARLAAFAGAAAVGGLAGGLAVQLAAVADPGAYDSWLSFKLLVAVLVGGATTALGPVAGVLALGALSLAADVLADLTGADEARFGTLLAALLLLVVLTVGSDGIVPALARLHRRSRSSVVEPLAAAGDTGAAELDACGLEKRFGGVTALGSFDLRLRAGRIAALIGPNGSGKTTALRLVAGTLGPDNGSVSLNGDDVTGASTAERARRGLVRTIQAGAVFPELTALENAVVGASLRRRHGGALRALVATPKARDEARLTRARAMAALAAVGLEAQADTAAGTLNGAEQRLLMIASALATEPSVLLVDEPSAGAGPADLERLAVLLRRLRDRGLAVLVVEHNLRLVRAIADEVVVLDAGVVLATGTPDDVARDEAVRTAYLGRRRL
jgi:branched-chain amino acid transport system permease protein